MNNVMLEIGNIKIYYYSVFILIAIIIGITFCLKEARKVNIGSAFMRDLLFNVIIVAIIGARLYYVTFNFQEFKDNLLSVLYIWEGGMAIYGSVIASALYIIYYCKKKERPILKTMDVIVPFLILGQAIGRWGNFLNQEAYGPVVSRSFLENLHIPNFVIDGMYINGAYHQPTFFYESLWCLLGFALLMIIRHFIKKIKDGDQTFIYFIWYGIGRFFIEGLREDSLYFQNFRISQIVSIILLIIGISGILTRRKRNLYYEGKENSNVIRI